MENKKESYKTLILSRMLKLVSNQYDAILNQYFAPLGLTASQGEVLAYLCQESDRVVETDELSAALQVSPATLTKILNNLAKKNGLSNIMMPVRTQVKNKCCSLFMR